MMRRIAFLSTFLLGISAGMTENAYTIIRSYPHDPHSFTQGLVYVDNHLYESTGEYGRSTLRMDDLETGKPLQQYDVPAQFFAEGLTDWRTTLIQLTWKEHTAFVYDRFSFRLLRTIQYEGEGWGLTHDAHNLILSDGTADLRFLDPNTFREVRRITVIDHGQPVTQLNELEYIRGVLFANVWHSSKIARISPRTGAVLGWLDFSDIAPKMEGGNPEAVLNGIAYDSSNGRLFITGKLWPQLFEIKLSGVPSQPPHHSSN